MRRIFTGIALVAIGVSASVSTATAAAAVPGQPSCMTSKNCTTSEITTICFPEWFGEDRDTNSPTYKFCREKDPKALGY